MRKVTPARMALAGVKWTPEQIEEMVKVEQRLRKSMAEKVIGGYTITANNAEGGLTIIAECKTIELEEVE
jgi:hypothetical protein